MSNAPLIPSATVLDIKAALTAIAPHIHRLVQRLITAHHIPRHARVHRMNGWIATAAVKDTRSAEWLHVWVRCCGWTRGYLLTHASIFA